jgi:hypothetical protein
MRLLIVLLALCWASSAEAQSQYSVVRISSHGGSGTVIQTGEGRSLILSAAHMFKGRDRSKRMTFDMPSPQPGPAQRIESRLLATDEAADLALIQVDVGPLPYVCPVAPATIRPGICLSVGFDSMQIPPQCRETHIIGGQGCITTTREKPWHGRSGGALIDQQTGYLVGVVSGYSRTEGIYVSHSAVLSFLSGGRSQPADSWHPQLTQPTSPFIPMPRRSDPPMFRRTQPRDPYACDT